MAAERAQQPDEVPLVRDARLCLLAKRDEAVEFLAWGADQIGMDETESWGAVPVAAVLHFLGGADELAARFECKILARAGGYFAVLVPLAQLLFGPGPGTDRLIAHPALLEVSVGRLGRPGANGSAGPAAQRVAPRDAVRLQPTPPRTGQGILLGVVDTVFDHAHPAFLDELGMSRVRWMWDVNATASDASVPTGRRYTADELRQPGFKIDQWELHSDATADEVLARVWRTHGTIVASIAAGFARDGSFQGVAPHTDLVFVGAGNETTGRIGDAADLLAGLHSLMSDPGPVVANLSTADCLGPHDGTLLGERLLDELLLRPGRTVAVCAGNFGIARSAGAGQGYRHDHAVVPACDGVARFVLRFDQSLSLANVAEIWIDARDLPEVEISGAITDGGEVRFSVLADEQPVAQTIPPFPSHACGRVLAVMTRASGKDDRWCLSVFFHPAAAARNGSPFFPASTWQFTVRGARRRVHAWLDRNNLERGGWQAPLPRSEWLAGTIGSPATARRVIAVGGVDASLRPLPSGTGLGPTIDGRQKPDLSARGESVVSAAPGGPQPWGDSGAGTSIATPLVAGAVALQFEAWGEHARHATWYDIRQALLRGAVLPGGQSGWDPAFGFGTLDVSRGLDPPARNVDLCINRTPDDDGSEPLVREFLCDSPDITVADPAPDGTIVVAVTVRNRGLQPTANVRVRLFLGDIGAAGSPDSHGGSAWTTQNIVVPVQTIGLLAPGATTVVRFQMLADPGPAMLLAAADNRDDPLAEDAAPSSSNNMALRTLGRGPPAQDSGWTKIALRGSSANDGVWLRSLDGSGRLALRGLPVGSLPWREAAIYEQTGRRPRPKFGKHGVDPAAEKSAVLDDAEAIRTRTDIEGAARLVLSAGIVEIEASGSELWLPRLRLANGAVLRFEVRSVSPTSADTKIGLTVYSDGRRVGSATLV